MDGPSCRFLSWFTCFAAFVILEAIVPAHSWCTPNPSPRHEARFKQKTNKFWEYQEQSNTWVEISVPFDLMSCINGTCTKVGSIEQLARKPGHDPPVHSQEEEDTRLQGDDAEDANDPVLPIRKRISLTRMSESSVWVTGQSGSIYERFWNGVMWVIAPHELPTSAGYATATFIVNTTILALSEAGILYQVSWSRWFNSSSLFRLGVLVRLPLLLLCLIGHPWIFFLKCLRYDRTVVYYPFNFLKRKHPSFLLLFWVFLILTWANQIKLFTNKQ